MDMGSCTTEERIIVTLSRQFRDGDQVCNGMASFLPVAAFMLARLTHAPGLVWVAGTVGYEPRPGTLPPSTLEAPLWRDSVMYMDHWGDFWTYLSNRRWLTKFCVGPAQLDRYGNANNTLIGDRRRPRVRLPGSAGMGDVGSIGKSVYYWIPRHSPRTLVERVDFVSCAGYLDGASAREDLGLAGGPELVVTDLAVLGFDAGSKRLRLEGVHPGVTVAQVQASTGFELMLPSGPVPETPPPTDEELHLLRKVIDPHGMRSRRSPAARRAGG
jgi:glutaconate CoA-transferase, subunit B